ncbi:hypothetical protein [Treponema sp. R6D11]
MPTVQERFKELQKRKLVAESDMKSLDRQLKELGIKDLDAEIKSLIKDEETAERELEVLRKDIETSLQKYEEATKEPTE